MNSRTQKGFTLIELMIVVVIVGILAAIGYPSYTQHVLKANRAAAEGFMLDLANKQEQFRLDSRRYFCTNSGGCANVVTVSSAAGSNYVIPAEVGRNYAIQVTTDDAATPLAYTITAQPIAGSAQARDTRCASLTLNQSGTKGASPGAVAECW